MKKLRFGNWILMMLLVVAFTSCNSVEKEASFTAISQKQNEAAFNNALQNHLDAVMSKDLAALKATMSPKGNMELIQPSSEIVYGVDGFMKFHQEWFAVPDWTVETIILSTDIGETIGVATTKFMYKEPERNGKPYFNRLIVSYTLGGMDGVWYVIKDHASSIEKTKS
jgi:hypothetical protein